MRPALYRIRKSSTRFSRQAAPYVISCTLTATILLATKCRVPIQKDSATYAGVSKVASTTAPARPSPDPQLPSLLTASISNWNPSELVPSELLSHAARANPALIVHAILSAHKKNLSSSVILDIGANGGHPVTRYSLDAAVGLVISAEPDPRNYVRLERLKKTEQTKFVIARGAVSDSVGKKDMAFSKARDDFTCFTCLDKRKPDTYTKTVIVHTVDELMATNAVEQKDWPVLILKTDTQGHEPEVLAGAKELLSEGRRVRYLIAEFDLKLLMKRDRATGLVLTLLRAGFRCMHLVFSGMTEQKRIADKYSRFGSEISEDNVESFVDFVRGTGEFTDIFCARK